MAATLLDADLHFGDFPDAELNDCPQSRTRILEVFRHFRPSLVLAHSANDYHADHRAASAITEAVTWFSASRGNISQKTPLDIPPTLWWMDTTQMIDFQPEFFIDVTAYVDIKHQMLTCHRSQNQRGENNDFSPLKDLMAQQYTTRGAQVGVAAAKAFQSHHAWKRGRAW